MRGALSNPALQLSTPQLEVPELPSALDSISNSEAGPEYHDRGRSRFFPLKRLTGAIMKELAWNCSNQGRSQFVSLWKAL